MKTILEYPELFDTVHGLKRIKPLILARGNEAALDSDYQPNIAVLVRTKNNCSYLTSMFGHINRIRTAYSGRIDIIIVDTESTDGTLEIAQQYGATLVNVKQDDFSYPRTLNQGLQAVKPDVIATFITVGHALPVLSNCLPAAVRSFKDPVVVGTFAHPIVGKQASFLEKLSSEKKYFSRPAHEIVSADMGVFGATNCMVRMATWRQKNFDTSYAQGGEDTAWADWALTNGYKIVVEPAMTVHHYHGLGPINLIRQHKHWKQVIKKALPFNQAQMEKRRPDLFK